MSKELQSPTRDGITFSWAKPGAMICFLFFFLLTPTAAKETQVFRCTGDDGHVEFRQQPCLTGRQNTMVIQDYKTGWKKPLSAQKPRKKKRRQATQKTRSRSNNDKHRRNERCWKMKARVERTEWRMRRGYKAGQGAGLRQTLREYEDYLSRFCR